VVLNSFWSNSGQISVIEGRKKAKKTGMRRKSPELETIRKTVGFTRLSHLKTLPAGYQTMG